MSKELKIALEEIFSVVLYQALEYVTCQICNLLVAPPAPIILKAEASNGF